MSFSLCSTPKRCSSSIINSPRSLNPTSPLNRRCVPISTSTRPDLALAIMYALTEKADKLNLKCKKGQVTVTMQQYGDKTALKAPSVEIFNRIVEMVRSILHLEEDKASMPLALGLRNGQVELQVKVERGSNKESLRFKFPDLT